MASQSRLPIPLAKRTGREGEAGEEAPPGRTTTRPAGNSAGRWQDPARHLAGPPRARRTFAHRRTRPPRGPPELRAPPAGPPHAARRPSRTAAADLHTPRRNSARCRPDLRARRRAGSPRATGPNLPPPWREKGRPAPAPTRRRGGRGCAAAFVGEGVREESEAGRRSRIRNIWRG
ncbi:unnamed protein product [Urochloa humidicola]